MPLILIADRSGRYLDANEDALALLGMTLEQVRAARVGDLSGPHSKLVRMIWQRLAPLGFAMPTGESTLYCADGSPVRVRYDRIEPREGGAFEIEFVPVACAAEREGPPAATHPTEVLEQWRAAERAVEEGDTDGALTGATALRDLYQHSLAEKGRDLAKL